MILRFSHTPELKITSWLMVFVMMFYSVGCQYYKAKPKPAEEVLNIRNIGAIQKTFIVHSGADTYVLEELPFIKE